MRKYAIDSINQIFRLIMKIKINISEKNHLKYDLSKFDIANLNKVKKLTDGLLKKIESVKVKNKNEMLN